MIGFPLEMSWSSLKVDIAKPIDASSCSSFKLSWLDGVVVIRELLGTIGRQISMITKVPTKVGLA